MDSGRAPEPTMEEILATIRGFSDHPLPGETHSAPIHLEEVRVNVHGFGPEPRDAATRLPCKKRWQT